MARRTVSSNRGARPATPPAFTFDARALQQLLDGDQHDIRDGGYGGGGDIARAIRTLVGLICQELRPHAVPRVDAFGIPDEILGAAIAGTPDSESRGVARH